MKIQLLEAEHILVINQEVCTREKQTSHCRNRHALESAIGAAFYPGVYPFQYGGLASGAGALCYFLAKAHPFMDGNKENSRYSFCYFLDIHGYELRYVINTQMCR
jgi:prophage maintenance system killer protein